MWYSIGLHKNKNTVISHLVYFSILLRKCQNRKSSTCTVKFKGKSDKILLRISLLCALRIYLTAFDVRRSTFDVRRRPGYTSGAFSVQYLFNMTNYPPGKIIVKCFHLS